MTPDQYRREGAEAMRLDILDLLVTAAVTGDHPDDPLTAIIHAIDVDEILEKLDIFPDAVERLVGKLSFPSDWRDRCGGMNMKQQGIWSDGFRTCREQALAAMEVNNDH